MLSKLPGIMSLAQHICNHRSAVNYFADSLNALDTCRYSSFEWNGTYEGAKTVVKRIQNNDTCSDCPEMGMTASKGAKSGIFIVITGAERPYCSTFNLHSQIPTRNWILFL